MHDPVEAYFTQLRDIYNSGAGVAETTFYPALCGLLTAIGSKLKPKVTALTHLRNTGAGIPDGGLYTADQLRGWDIESDPLGGQHPKRGAIEVKGTSDNVATVAASEQVARYVEHYGLVLVTNLRDFVLVGRDVTGSGTRTLESWSLATSESVFWARVQQPRKLAEETGEGLTEFLRRALLHDAPLSDPKELAWFLASYARTARLRLEQHHDLPALGQLRTQLEDSLGLKFDGDKGDHFFRSTLVQTLFYGMFASWVLWARDMDHNVTIPWDRRFEWETASRTLHVPMVAELFYQFSNPGRLRDLDIAEILEWAEEVLWRVDRAAFFQHFREDHAVQYFYEPFLEAFDPELRKELGVWYTPDEVVKYMVDRVDTVLREDLGIMDGLADPSVVVLDPCCGTGAYLVEVLRRIDATLQAKGADALTRNDVKRAAMDRVVGFEIMPAPFVIAHLQMGILLADLGVPLRDADERAAVYLTNSLTGWKTTQGPRHPKVGAGQLHSTLLIPEFAEERDAANRVKREQPILVVIGNPPYNSFAGTSPEEEEGLVQPYKEGLARDWGIRKYNLDDLYVRFLRLAERRIAEIGGFGIMCLISNFSYLRDPSYVVMRDRLTSEFDGIWIDNLNGDSRETGKTTPEGKPDPSVFSTPQNRQGIRVGTAIFLASRGRAHHGRARIRYREFWGTDKRAALLASLDRDSTPAYVDVETGPSTRYALYPSSDAAEYEMWPRLVDLAGSDALPGLEECRGGDLIDYEPEALLARLRPYFDADRTTDSLRRSLPGLTRVSASFNPEAVRANVLETNSFNPAACLPFLVRPFDFRWCYWTPATGVWNRPRPALAKAREGNLFLISRMNCAASSEGPPVLVAESLFDKQTINRNPAGIPFTVGTGGQRQANLSAPARKYLRALGIVDLDAHSEEASTLWLHSLAVCYSPLYLKNHAGPLRREWPRIPLPKDRRDLSRSAELGVIVSEMLLPGPVSVVLPNGFASLQSTTGAVLDPSRDLSVTARWGIAGKDGITMPSAGRLEDRPYTTDERAAIAENAEARGLSTDQAIAIVGETCFDVYLNDAAYWRCVPANVWKYTIGGYQVIKKWLSYRERALLGRDLTSDEARYVGEIVRRIAALLLMQPELDRNYERVKADVWNWESDEPSQPTRRQGGS